VPAGVAGIRRALDYELSLTQPRDVHKLLQAGRELLDMAPGAPAPIATWAAFALAAIAFPRGRIVLAPIAFAGIAAHAWDHGAEHTTALYFVIYGSLAGALIALLAAFAPASATAPAARPIARSLAACVWIPSLLAGVTAAFASDNGAMNAAIGLFPAFVFTGVVLPDALGARRPPPAAASGRASRGGVPAWLDAIRRWSPRGRAVDLAAMITMTVMSAALVMEYQRGVYRDEHTDKLDTTVALGPFRGLRTTRSRARLIEDVTRAVRAHADPSGDARIVAYYDFPAAYLMTRMRPAMPSVWTDARIAVAPVMMDYYRRHLTGRGLVLRWPVANHTGVTALERLAESPDRILERRPGFTLYREPPPPR
jgi:hypothetical protein